MKKCNSFGVAVKKKLIDMQKTQAWLIEEVRHDTGLYVDSSYMSRILSGRASTPKLIDSICKIVGIKHP